MSDGLPPMYRCKVCGLALRPQDSVSQRLAVVWLKAKGTTISRVVEELHEYKHEFCDDKTIDQPMQPALF